MANRRRARIIPTDSWPELQPLLLFPDQEAYEVIRPVVLFGFTPLERSQETGVSARSIYRKAQRFEQHGLPGLLEAEERSDSKRLLPQPIRRAIVELKAEYSAFSAHELARICYAQFSSRVGFVHHYRTLSADAMRLVLAHKWQHLGLTLVPDDVNDAEAMAAVIRITGGNLRLVQRLFSQIERILPINRLQAVTPEVVEAARQSLVIGAV